MNGFSHLPVPFQNDFFNPCDESSLTCNSMLISRPTVKMPLRGIGQSLPEDFFPSTPNEELTGEFNLPSGKLGKSATLLAQMRSDAQRTLRNTMKEEEKRKNKEKEDMARKKREEKITRKKSEELIARKEREEEIARKEREEEIARKKREEEIARKKREEEIARKKREEEIARKKREEEIARKKREEEIARKKR